MQIGRHIIGLLSGVLLLSVPGVAQEAPAKSQEKLLDRFSIRTNAIDWLLTVPNIQIGFDVLPGKYNEYSALIGAKYNWNTFHQLPAFYVFNVLDIRGEGRYHFRRPQKPWLAFYVGGYADFSTYSLKITQRGRQGWQTGLGVSGGFEIPLYGYKSGVIDLDLGASAGLSLASFDYFTLSNSQTAYVSMGADRQLRVLPVITEIRATFSWRKHSVKEKYLEKDPDIKQVKQKLQDIDNNFKDTGKKTYDDFVSSKSKKERAAIAASDSLYRAGFEEWLASDVQYNLGQIEEMTIAPKRKEVLRKAVHRHEARIKSEFYSELKAIAKQKEQEAKAKEQEAKAKAKEQEAKEKEAKAKEKKEDGK